MSSLTEKIYYADENIFDIIKNEFELIDDKGWYQLYQHRTNRTLWRLNKEDKYQEQFFVRIDAIDDWINFDSTELQIELLLHTRGNADSNCVWESCNKKKLNGLAYCEQHAYWKMGIKR